MIRKETDIAFFKKQSHNKDDKTVFKTRQGVLAKDKQNIMTHSVNQAQALNILRKTKKFDSPDLIFALNQTIKQQAETVLNNTQSYFRNFSKQNKTFHSGHSQSTPKFLTPLSHLSPLIPRSPLPQKHYANNKERDKAIELAKWVSEKLAIIKSKKQYVLDDIMDYYQTVISYGFGEIVDSVSKKCKQEGKVLKFVWDGTWNIFENLLSLLSKSIQKKDQQLVDSQLQTQKIFSMNLDFIKNKNAQLEKHISLLYEKMKSIIVWNRKLRKQRVKKEIKNREIQYKLKSYESVLEEAAGLLMTVADPKQEHSLKLAKRIVTHLHRQKTSKCYKKKPLAKESDDYVFQKTKDFVSSWLKHHSTQEEQLLKDSLFLSPEEKSAINYLTPSEFKPPTNLFDFFITSSTSTQTTPQSISVCTQFQINTQKMNNVAVETKRISKSNVGIQVEFKSEGEESNMKKRRLNKLQSLEGKLVNGSFKSVHKSANGNKSILVNKLNKSEYHAEVGSTMVSKSGLEENTKSRKNIQFAEQSFIKSQQISDFVNQNVSELLITQQQRSQTSVEKGCKTSRIKISHVINEWDLKDEYEEQDRQEANSLTHKSRDDLTNKQQIKQSKEKVRRYSRIVTSSKLITFQAISDELSISGFRNKTKSKNRTQTNIQSQKNIRFKENKNNKKVVNRYGKGGTMKYISQPIEKGDQMNGFKSLKKINFEQTYENQMKNQVEVNKDQIVRELMKKRSFYNPNRNRNEKQQNQIACLWYEPFRSMSSQTKKQFNLVDEKIFNFYNKLNKTSVFPLNLTKSKTYNQNKVFFNDVSNSTLNVEKIIPKNKQFINLSIANLTKFISMLLFDYLKKFKSQYEGIALDSEKICYPLSIILVDHMTHKYGLREIAETKLRSFIVKLKTFVGISQRLSFFEKLLGIQNDMIGADQLLIYLKCLIFLDTSKTIKINTSKDFSVDKAITDKETVLNNVHLIIREFFKENIWEQVKWKIQRYFIMYYQMPAQFQIEKIANLLIEEFVSRKKQVCEHYLPIYRNCVGNFFPNLSKVMQIFNENSEYESKYNKMIQEIYKNSDILDENYGKSISQMKFIGMCLKLGFPYYKIIQQKMQRIKRDFCGLMSISKEYTVESQVKVNRLKRQYRMKINVEKQAPDYWLWTCAQVGYQVPLINSINLLGKLQILQKFCLA